MAVVKFWKLRNPWGRVLHVWDRRAFSRARGTQKNISQADIPLRVRVIGISYWNNYVAVTQMGGHGSFSDPLLGINIVQEPDLVQPKLARLSDYQFSLTTPPPPAGSFDAAAAARGKIVFESKQAKCATCHIPPLYTDINLGKLHAAAETGMDPAYAERTTTGKYRTTPLRALWMHAPYFHDGSAETLSDVVEHYDSFLRLRLTEGQKQDLVEFLKSL